MSVVRWWVYECNKMGVVLPVGWVSGGGEWGVPLVYECYKMVAGTSCGLGVAGWGSI